MRDAPLIDVPPHSAVGASIAGTLAGTAFGFVSEAVLANQVPGRVKMKFSPCDSLPQADIRCYARVSRCHFSRRRTYRDCRGGNRSLLYGRSHPRAVRRRSLATRSSHIHELYHEWCRLAFPDLAKKKRRIRLQIATKNLDVVSASSGSAVSLTMVTMPQISPRKYTFSADNIIAIVFHLPAPHFSVGGTFREVGLPVILVETPK